MVIIMNTKLEQDENDKTKELFEYFSAYNPKKVRHSYGLEGQQRRSVLIFELSARGYLDAERLHKHCVEQRTDRNAWNSRRRILFYPPGERQLYGFMAIKDDLDPFNQHMQGKSKMKFEIKSYQEMVVDQIKKMSVEERNKVNESNANTYYEYRSRAEYITEYQEKVENYEEKMKALKQRRRDEEAELEKQHLAELIRLYEEICEEMSFFLEV